MDIRGDHRAGRLPVDMALVKHDIRNTYRLGMRRIVAGAVVPRGHYAWAPAASICALLRETMVESIIRNRMVGRRTMPGTTTTASTSMRNATHTRTCQNTG